MKSLGGILGLLGGGLLMLFGFMFIVVIYMIIPTLNSAATHSLNVGRRFFL
jgi:hypothetical protein